jgi:hypothetical protein
MNIYEFSRRLITWLKPLVANKKLYYNEYVVHPKISFMRMSLVLCKQATSRREIVELILK